MIRSRRGFSLLELSVVLVMVAILLSFGLSIGTNAIKGSERSQTQERLRTIQAALESYVALNGYLPCPAARNVLPSAATFGTEVRSVGTPTVCDHTTPAGAITRIGAVAPNMFVGAVPTRALGLPDNYAGDSWGNKFTYAVSGQHVGSSASYATNDAPITIYTGNRSGTNYMITTRFTQRDPGNGATYVVVSHGPDAKGAYPYNGTAVSVACPSLAGSTNNDVENCELSNLIYYDSQFNDNPSQANTYFDDYLVWGSNMFERLSPTGGVGLGCASGSACEEWCAPCSNPIPNNSAYSAWAASSWIVCRRIIVTTAPCSAYCLYANPSHDVYCP